MATAWQSQDAPVRAEPIGAAGWALVVARGLVLGVVTFGCLGLLLLVRLIERPLCGVNRPVTPHITQFVCRAAFRILGMRHSVRGTPMREGGAVVANHASWLDIFALNAPQRIYFVSKDEVRDWPGIGWLARATGTVFIARKSREAGAQARLFEARMAAGHRLLFFPEGTSTDGRRVLAFKTSLFQAFMTEPLREELHIQPVTVIYHAPEGADPRFYGWWGDMEFGAHFLKVLARPRQGAVEIVFHPPVEARDFADRKALARHCETQVRQAFPS